MTRPEAETIIRDFCANYPSVRLAEENKQAYVDALLPLPAKQTYHAVREVMYAEERFPSVAHLLRLIREAEATKRGQRPASYSGRGCLQISDICEQCGRRITDAEFEDGNWEFVQNAAEEVNGRVHRRCYPKADHEKPARAAAELPF